MARADDRRSDFLYEHASMPGNEYADTPGEKAALLIAEFGIRSALAGRPA